MTSTAIELFRKMGEVSLLPDVSTPSISGRVLSGTMSHLQVPQSDPLLQAQKFNRSVKGMHSVDSVHAVDSL
jgi:hypothetical protein